MPGDWDDTGLGRELLGRGVAVAFVSQLSEDLGRVDGPDVWERLEPLPIGVRPQLLGHEILAWNVFGLADILNVLRGAIQLGLADPDQVAVMTAFPMSLLPTFVVPLVTVTHVLIFVRLWRLRTELATQYAA